MASQKPLSGIVLIDCARANANQGINEAAQQCGYGKDADRFLQELGRACQTAGIPFETLEDLAPTPPISTRTGIEIAPETPSEL
jgi:hypothetical protein